MKKVWLMLLVFALVPLCCGCTKTEQGMGAGAAIGGIAGGIIGNQSHHAGEGAAIGAGLGVIAGGLIGKGMEDQEAARPAAASVIVTCPSCATRVDVTGFPRGSQVRCPKCGAIFTAQS